MCKRRTNESTTFVKVVLSSEGSPLGEPPPSDDKIINRAAPRHREYLNDSKENNFES